MMLPQKHPGYLAQETNQARPVLLLFKIFIAPWEPAYLFMSSVMDVCFGVYIFWLIWATYDAFSSSENGENVTPDGSL